MQRIVLGGLSLLLTTVALMPGVKAQTMENRYVGNANPAQVVSLAERGYLRDQGIPMGNQLSSAYEFGRLTAKQVIEAAVTARRIPASALEDSRFITAVNDQLHRLSSQGDGSN